MASVTERPKAEPRCAISSAARAPDLPRWPISACRSRPASPSPPRSARHYYANGKRYPPELERQVEAGLDADRAHRRQTLRRSRQSTAGLGPFGRPRIDARHDGHGSQSRPQRRAPWRRWREKSGDRRFAYDSYRRFITMYSDVVLGIDHHHFEELLDDHKDRNGYLLDTDLDADDWVELTARYKERLEEEHGAAVPAGPARAILGSDRCGLRLVDEPARHHLSAASSTSRKAGAPRSMFRPWCSAIWARPRPPASPSPATHRPARTGSMASS